MNSVSIEDKNTIELLSQGSEDAFEQIYNRYCGMVVKVSYHITGNSEDARDITQKVFCELSRKADELKGYSSIGGWLYNTTRNISKTHLRSLNRMKKRENRYHYLYDEDSEFIDCETIRIIEDEIQYLPEEYRDLIVQHYYEGLPQSEIAVRNNINASTLRNRMQKAREILEGRLKLREISVLGVFLSTMESKAGTPFNIPIPGSGESFQLIKNTGGLFMKTLITTVIAAVLIAGFVMANPDKKQAPPKILHVKAEQLEVKELTNAHNEFGFKLLKVLHKKGENTFISPTSLSTAFGMMYNGTVNEVRKEFTNVLGWNKLKPEGLNSASRQLISGLLSKDKESIVEIANSIWIRKGFEVNPNFKSANIKYFGSEVNSAPFNEETVYRINEWVSEKTHNKINNIIQELDADQLIVLINAVYFKGLWQTPFESYATTIEDFNHEDGSKISIPLMGQFGVMKYCESEAFKAVRLPFGNGDVAMTFILPVKGLSEFQKSLTPEIFQNIQKKFKYETVSLKLPRFKIGFRKAMKPVLQKMGLRKSFDLTSGFARINHRENLGISDVIHQTILEVRESGAEAAAVTLKPVAGGELPDKSYEVKIDRPFLCAISNLKTGNVIFLGTVYKPKPIMEELVSIEINKRWFSFQDSLIEFDKTGKGEIDKVLRSKGVKTRTSSCDLYEWRDYGLMLYANDYTKKKKGKIAFNFLFNISGVESYKEFFGRLSIEEKRINAKTSIKDLQSKFGKRLIREEGDLDSYYLLLGEHKVEFFFGTDGKKLLRHVGIEKNHKYAPPAKDADNPFE